MSIRYGSSLTLLAAVLTSAALVSSTATAAVQSDPVVVTGRPDAELLSKKVSYRDLSLAHARDQRRLNRRIDTAVKEVCLQDYSYASRTRESYAQYLSCSAAAWTNARPQIAAAINRANTQVAAGGSAVASGAIIVSARTGN